MMKKILLIEDEETSLELALSALKRLGYTDITCAEDGESGRKLLDSMEPKPDVVISDIFMPNKDGIEIVNELVARKFAGELILVSGGDPRMLPIAKLVAVNGGLNLLAALLKPLNEQALEQVLPSVSSS